MTYRTLIFASLLGAGLTLPGWAQQSNQDARQSARESSGQSQWLNPGELFDRGGQLSYQYDDPESGERYWTESRQEMGATGGGWEREFQPRTGGSATIFLWVPSEQRWRSGAEAQRQGGEREQWQSRMSSRQTSGRMTCEGTVEGFRSVQVQRQGQSPREHILARLNVGGGDFKVVDLGRQEEAQKLDIQSGDYIRVTGREGQVEDQSALLADTVQYGNQSVTIQREGQQAAQSEWMPSIRRQQQTGWQSGLRESPRESAMSGQAQQQQQQQMTVAGIVEGFREARIQRQGQAPQEHTLVRITLDSGESRVIDLGRRTDLPEIDLEAGDYIRVTGRQGEVEGQMALLAENLQAGGRQVTIQREMQPGERRQTTIALQPPASQETFQGMIDGFRQVQRQGASGEEEEQTLVRITLENGQSKVVNLGRRLDLEQLNLESGKQIRVTGREDRSGAEPELKAESIEVGNERFNINREEFATSFAGRIKDYRMARVAGARDDHLLVRLELQNGDEVVADFGPNASLERLGLNREDQIRIRGHRAQVNGRSILVAREVFVEGQQTPLNR